MEYFLPFNLDLEEHVRMHPPTNIPNFSIDKLAFFLHLVNAIPSKNKKLDLPCGFTPMMAEILQSYDYHYRKYLDYACDEDAPILMEDRQYVVGEKARAFKFIRRYQTKVVPFESTNKRFAHSLLLKKEREVEVPKDLKFLTKPFQSGGLEFDLEGAIELLDRRDKYYERHPEEVPKRKQKRKIMAEYEGVGDELFYEAPEMEVYKNPTELYNSAILTFHRIATQDHPLKVDKTSGRFHSNITNMPSEWRNFLTYEGEELENVDIANSQPYISLTTFKPQFWDVEFKSQPSQEWEQIQYEMKDYSSNSIIHHTGNMTISDVSQTISKQLIQNKTDYRTYIMLVEPEETLYRQVIQQYRDLCSKGVFYEYLEKEIGNKLGATYANKKAVKTAVFQMMFSHNRFIGLPEAAPKRAFKEILYPVYKLFNQIKRRDKALLACLLQSIESKLILHKICKRIHRERPDVLLITVHDSIITTKKDAAYVRRIMNEELTMYVGLPPTLKSERLHPDNVKNLWRD